MKRFSPRMFPHRVWIRRQIETSGRAAGPVESFPSPVGEPLPCRIRYHLDREAYTAESDTAVCLVAISFPDDPGGVKQGDRVLDTRSREFRATGPIQPRDADDALFVLDCQVID